MVSDNKQMLAALDVGTSEVRCVVARLVQATDDASTLSPTYDVVGIGTARCKGMEFGVITDMNATVDAIHKAINGAVAACGDNVTEVVVGITGSHLHFASQSSPLPLLHQEVMQSDIDQVINNASLFPAPEGMDPLFVEPQEFTVQGRVVRNPLGMTTSLIQANVSMIYGRHNHIEDLRRCVLRSGVEVQRIIPAARASAASVLTKDECLHGVVLLDIGAGTTDVAVYMDGALRCTGVVPIGGNLVTSDIAQVLHMQNADAERLKIEKGYALRSLVGVDGTSPLRVPKIGHAGVSDVKQGYLAEIIEARWREIFALVCNLLEKWGYISVPAMGVVLTGGSCLMPGVDALCAEMLHTQSVRKGTPSYEGLYADVVNQPGFATAMGLLDLGMQQRFAPHGAAAMQKLSTKLQSLWQKAMDWLHGEG